MHRTPKYIILSALVAALPGSATAQSPAYAAAPDTTIDPSIVRLIEAANTRGLPSGPLLAKVREGRLKRATTPRIRNALAALVARLDSARSALGPSASADELVAGADALAAGASVGDVRAIRAAALGQPAGAPLGALAQLVASGVPAARAVSMVVELLRRRASPSQVLTFGNLVESDVVSGLPAEESATLRLHSFDARTGDAPVLDATAPAISSFGGASTAPPKSAPPTTKPKRRP